MEGPILLFVMVLVVGVGAQWLAWRVCLPAIILLAAGGLLTVALDSISDGSSRYQFALNGLLLIVVAVRFPAGLVGAARRRRR